MFLGFGFRSVLSSFRVLLHFVVIRFKFFLVFDDADAGDVCAGDEPSVLELSSCFAFDEVEPE